MAPCRILQGPLAALFLALPAVAAIDPGEAPARGGEGSVEGENAAYTSLAARAARDREDLRARAAFDALTPDLQREFVQYLELETGRLGTFQVSLVEWILREHPLDTRSLAAWPEPEWFDPTEHAPAQPIARRTLEPDSRAAEAARATILGHVPRRATTPAVRYHDGRREILRLPVTDEPRRVFENALAGAPLGFDRAEAVLERLLDDGGQRDAARAFDHAYTDRVGNVYPGITLYDAWASGAEIEMPDVDTLGIVHLLLPDRREWIAPVPAHLQRPLYDAIGEKFSLLHRQRSLRRALVATWLFGSEPLRDGFDAARDNLHALWEDCASTPATMAARLPRPEDRPAFLEAWAKRCHEPDSPFQAGVHRRETLDQDAARVRACVLRGLVEFGVLAPAPSTPPPPPR